MNFRSLVNFDKMITPTIIKILFYISIAASVIFGIVTMIGGFVTAIDQGSVWPAVGGLFGGPLAMVLGIFIARIYSELLILAFKIHEHLVAIRNMMASKQ
jgi:membrane protein YdbS with pleckstrin-like domain